MRDSLLQPVILHISWLGKLEIWLLYTSKIPLGLVILSLTLINAGCLDHCRYVVGVVSHAVGEGLRYQLFHVSSCSCSTAFAQLDNVTPTTLSTWFAFNYWQHTWCQCDSFFTIPQPTSKETEARVCAQVPWQAWRRYGASSTVDECYDLLVRYGNILTTTYNGFIYQQQPC